MAHARRKFFDLHAAANNSPIAATALEFIGKLYEVERLAAELPPEQTMNENSVVEALRALVTSGSKKSGTARLRLVFDEVERRFSAGISCESMPAFLFS